MMQAWVHEPISGSYLGQYLYVPQKPIVLKALTTGQHEECL